MRACCSNLNINTLCILCLSTEYHSEVRWRKLAPAHRNQHPLHPLCLSTASGRRALVKYAQSIQEGTPDVSSSSFTRRVDLARVNTTNYSVTLDVSFVRPTKISRITLTISAPLCHADSLLEPSRWSLLVWGFPHQTDCERIPVTPLPTTPIQPLHRRNELFPPSSVFATTTTA